MTTHVGLKGTGKFSSASVSKTGVIYIPSDLVKDSAFPLKEGDKVEVEIKGDMVIIKKAK